METNNLNNPAQPDPNLSSVPSTENTTSNVPSADASALAENNELQEESTPDSSIIHEEVSLEKLSKEELVERASMLLSTLASHNMGHEIENIRAEFYKKHNQELSTQKAQHEASGHEGESFVPAPDPLEHRLKEIFADYKNRKHQHHLQQEKEREGNYEKKVAIVEGIKELINQQESLNHTFNQFKELQQQWHDAGQVPQDKYRDLQDSYNHTIENFYAYIKINKELRDLDLKKNLEAKTDLCEKAEKLVLETSIVKAFQTLQKYHEMWRETGPVPREKKDEIWERFKEATSLINKKHQEYFEGMKDQLTKNLEAKTELCEKVESLLSQELNTPKDWEDRSNELIELQNIWKTIGFAPKKENTQIYERFRTACDKFFDAKREFFKGYKSDQVTNLQQKTDLCVQAENLKDNTDWKKTTDEFIRIQKKWKTIGPVPRKHSDIIWKRFRAACDHFFEQKNKFFSNMDEAQEENLQKKKALIEELKQYQNSEDSEANFKTLQGFQQRWSEIGHVPIADKEAVNQEFRNLINSYYDSLNMDEFNKNIHKFRSKLENYKSEGSAGDRVNTERNKIISKIKQLETDITLWENNIGFFAKSKKSDALIRDFTHKIESSKKQIELLNKKLDMIDDLSK